MDGTRILDARRPSRALAACAASMAAIAITAASAQAGGHRGAAGVEPGAHAQPAVAATSIGPRAVAPNPRARFGDGRLRLPGGPAAARRAT